MQLIMEGFLLFASGFKTLMIEAIIAVAASQAGLDRTSHGS